MNSGGSNQGDWTANACRPPARREGPPDAIVAGLTPDAAQRFLLRVLAALSCVVATAAVAAPRVLRVCSGMLVYDNEHETSLVNR